jgi:hypothetical protein
MSRMSRTWLPRTRSRALAGVTLAALVSAAGAARAEPTDPPPSAMSPAHESANPKTPTLFDRPHTIAEVDLGLLTLPTAPISPAQSGGSIPIAQKIFTGDTTAELGLHLLYRATPDFVIGAGASFAPNPNSDSQYVSGGASSFTRTHSRGYLLLGGEARYYALRAKWIEGFVGLLAGTVVVADRFETTGTPVVGILGTREVTVRTTGFAFGVQAGANYIFTDNLVFGLNLRATRWLLPEGGGIGQCDAIGDCPTLTGSVAAFEIGLALGYRIPL